jgi:predicted acetyltransferase
MTRQSDGLILRPVTAAEVPMLGRLVNQVFLQDSHDDELEQEAAVFEPERSIAIFDADQPVSSAAAYTRDMTVPGGPIPVAAVTWVAVAPTHRRRGLMTRMMRHQLDELHDEGREPVAVLWASESVIYGRFGYGLASRYLRMSIATSRLGIRQEVNRGSGRLQLCKRDEALPALRAVYETVRTQRVGYLDRRGNWWDARLFDPERWREGATALRFAVHSDEAGQPDGYVIFNVKSKWEQTGPSGQVNVRELQATNPAAYAAACAFVLEMDLVREVRWERAAVDEPVPHLVTDPRALQPLLTDALWVRLVDVDRALQARRYTVPVDVVLDVSDSFCAWNTGRYRLTADGHGAACSRTTDPVELTVSSTALGAAYLGGTTLTSLAAAGLVVEHRPGALNAASIGFAGLREPFCPEVF